jgi:hypothetical protein
MRVCFLFECVHLISKLLFKFWSVHTNVDVLNRAQYLRVLETLRSKQKKRRIDNTYRPPDETTRDNFNEMWNMVRQLKDICVCSGYLKVKLRTTLHAYHLILHPFAQVMNGPQLKQEDFLAYWASNGIWKVVMTLCPPSMLST